MAANPDHIRRDAEHAARTEIAVFLAKFQRRMYEEAKAHIAEEISGGAGGVLDGTHVGRTAASRAIAAYETGEPISPYETRELETSSDYAA